MDMLAYRNALVAAVKERLPALRAVQPYSGKFDLEELKAISVALPAVFVSLLGFPESRITGDERLDAKAQVVLYIVAKSEPRLPAGDACLSIVGDLLPWLTSTRFGLTNIGEPEALAAENLFTDSLRANGVCLWAVGFRQIIRLGAGEALPPPIPAELYLGIAPDVGPPHIDDYYKLHPQEAYPA